MSEPMAASPTPLAPLALASYRHVFFQQVAQGQRRQIVLPQALVATLFLPIIWVAIPHNDRSWLYRARWFVFALALLVNYEQAARVSSNNVGWAVVSGLMSTFGTMLCFHYMILTNPQRDAARIIKISQKGPNRACTDVGESQAPPQPSAHPATAATKIRLKPQPESTASHVVDTPDFGGNCSYVWQRFPSEAPFLVRLGWAADLVLSFRGAGWSSSISVIPKPYTSTDIQDGQPVCVASIPPATRAGFEYIHSPTAFLQHRLKLMAAACLVLDFLGTFMMKDPYFIFGREKSVEYALPWYLAGLSPWRLEAYRQLFSITGAFSAVAAACSFADVVHYYVTACWCPSRNVPWLYTSAFGSLGEVFDRGLAGLWGSWWHQTFRQQFLGPSAFLLKKGLIRKGTVSGSLVALLSTFAMSGLLHGMGSLSAVPQTKLWSQPAFFLLQGVGIILQQQLASLLQRIWPVIHVTVRRVGNASFALLWLYVTSALFNDDMAAMGLWLLEPVPFSVFRAMGFGFPGDAAWRWDSSYLFRWHSGRHWWQSGIAI